jgi:hypothetical protein
MGGARRLKKMPAAATSQALEQVLRNCQINIQNVGGSV